MNQKKTVEQTWKKLSAIFKASPSAHPAECQADRLVDFVLEQILGYLEQMGHGRFMDRHGVMARAGSHSGDSVNQLETMPTMPSKVEARHTEGWI